MRQKTKYYLKDNIDFKNLEKFGYASNYNGSYWYKFVTSRRIISILRYNRSIDDDVIDSTTYTGFKYEGEYRHQVKKYIQDLVQAGLVEEGE